VDRVGGDEARQQSRRGAAIAHVESARGLEEAAGADSVHGDIVAVASDPHAHRAQCRGGRAHVGALRQAGDPASAGRHRRAEQGAVRDRLVAGDARGPAKRS
jgi:hypothetical protein